MELLIFRHGPAEERHPKSDDRVRPLTAEGKKKTALAAAGLAALDLRPDLVLTSPLVRADQTAKILAAAFRPAPPIEVAEALSPGGEPEPLVGSLRSRRLDRVALVGHEPALSTLLSSILAGDPSRLQADVKKAGAALVELGPRGSATLLALFPPRALRLLGGGKD